MVFIGNYTKGIKFPSFYVTVDKSSYLSHLKLKNTGMLSQVGNPLVLLKLENLMGKYGIPFYVVN